MTKISMVSGRVGAADIIAENETPGQIDIVDVDVRNVNLGLEKISNKLTGIAIGFVSLIGLIMMILKLTGKI